MTGLSLWYTDAEACKANKWKFYELNIESVGKSMSGNELIINVTQREKRVALLQNSQLVELHIELSGDTGIVGNIYQGRVLRVLPGMQAAFVDIGLDRAAFLYVADVIDHFAVYDDSLNANGDIQTGDLDRVDMEVGLGEDESNRESQEREEIPQKAFHNPDIAIEELLRDGQEIVVQVAKEPIGTKGARLTSHISLPGRNLVLMPDVDHVGVSRRIEDEGKRVAMKEMIDEMRPEKMGFIVRTVAEGKDQEALRSDMEFLLDLWQKISKESETARAPALLHSDLSITLRAIRDLFNADIERVVIDSKEEYEKILDYFGKHMPRLNYAIEQYTGEEPIFDHYGLEVEISRALQRKVWLKSGGYIVIEQTEALTAIDVNTGRFVGKRNLEDTILKTNLEAVKEICYQLRLRNIGGIIIIDFIDMEKESNREKVYNALSETLENDRAKTNILKISDLGLVEMTRKRIRDSISRVLSEPCPYCEGKGYVKSKTSICGEIFREIQREMENIQDKTVILNVHPDIADLLYEDERAGIEYLERKYNKRINVKDKSHYHIEQFEIIGT